MDVFLELVTVCCDLLFCLILGEEGHMSKDCETGPKTHTVQNEDGTTRGK